MSNSGLHIYVHIPFCVDPCGYCDFYRGAHREDRERKFVRALLAEIPMRVPRGLKIDSLYFGGGTPSLMSIQSWTAVIDAFSARGNFSRKIEISIEANPASVTQESAGHWRSLGINRISLGVQSLNDKILKFLNRLHTADIARGALRTMAESGFSSVNADLIYAIPGQTADEIAIDVREIAPMLQHLSAYSLTIEKNTPFDKKGIQSADSDISAEHYETVCRETETAGLKRYEISNFSIPGHECRHNLNTWQYGTYLGLGPAAVGFDGRRRYKIVPDLDSYAREIAQGKWAISDEEHVSTSQEIWDRLMLGLRTREGALLPGSSYSDMTDFFRRIEYLQFLICDAGRIRLKDEFHPLLDEILVRAKVRWEAESISSQDRTAAGMPLEAAL